MSEQTDITRYPRNELVKMTVATRKLPGWEDSKFLEEYEVVHANMTRGVAAVVPILRKYTQLVALPHKPVANLPDGGLKKFDAVTTLEWTTLEDLHESFQAPEYKASAGQHVFADETSQVGVLSKEISNITFKSSAFEERGDSATLMVALLRRSAGTQLVLGDKDLADRATLVESIGRETGLLRYVLNRSVTPKDLQAFFAGTPFAETDWVTTELMEQYWFPSRVAAETFLQTEKVARALFSTLPPGLNQRMSFAVLGKENRVVEKD